MNASYGLLISGSGSGGGERGEPEKEMCSRVFCITSHRVHTWSRDKVVC